MISGRVMALDRPEDDVGPELARPEQRLGPDRPVADAPAVDKDPATYVREAEQQDGQAPQGGSLRIGSLRRH